jgi:hypothetical protein
MYIIENYLNINFEKQTMNTKNFKCGRSNVPAILALGKKLTER